jgi:hypothetical protein
VDVRPVEALPRTDPVRADEAEPVRADGTPPDVDGLAAMPQVSQ